jgi:hypothetical protein
MPPRWMMDPDFEEDGYEYFNPEEDVYYSNYYNHSCNDLNFYDYDHYRSYFLYNVNDVDGIDKDISNIEECEDE